jgi:hypothetical protein
MTRCLWCPAGTYSDAPGATQCTPCPAGKTSQAQAEQCA